MSTTDAPYFAVWRLPRPGARYQRVGIARSKAELARLMPANATSPTWLALPIRDARLIPNNDGKE